MRTPGFKAWGWFVPGHSAGGWQSRAGTHPQACFVDSLWQNMNRRNLRERGPVLSDPACKALLCPQRALSVSLLRRWWLDLIWPEWLRGLAVVVMVAVVCEFRRVRLFATPWTVARQAPLPMGFSGQEYWNGLPFPSPGDLPDPGIESGSPAAAGGFLTSALPNWPTFLYILSTVQKMSDKWNFMRIGRCCVRTPTCLSGVYSL